MAPVDRAAAGATRTRPSGSWPSKSTPTIVATVVRFIVAQPDEQEVLAQHQRVMEQLSRRFPEAAAPPAEAGAEVPALAGCSQEHWRQIWANSPQERPSREIRRHTDGVGILPTCQTVILLVGAVLAEQNDVSVGRWRAPRANLQHDVSGRSRGQLVFR